MAAPIQATRNARSGRPRADIGADHGDERAAQSEDQRDEQIFEARAGAVTGDGRGAEGADQAGRDRDGQIGLHRDQSRDRADAKNVGKQRPAQPDAANVRRTTLRPERR